MDGIRRGSCTTGLPGERKRDKRTSDNTGSVENNMVCLVLTEPVLLCYNIEADANSVIRFLLTANSIIWRYNDEIVQKPGTDR